MKTTKPPLGIEPVYIWKQKRMISLIEAIARYTKEGLEADHDWLRELNELLVEWTRDNTTEPDLAKKPNDSDKPCLSETDRLEIIAKKWDVDWIRGQAGLDDDQWFKWDQLVWQEIVMWAKIGEIVTPEDFEFICNRRDFNLTQRQYLKDLLTLIDLNGLDATANSTKSEIPEKDDYFVPAPESLWLVIVESRYNVIRVCVSGKGFYIPGQEPCWGFSHVDKWIKEITPPEEE
jgi:hypothetical protein